MDGYPGRPPRRERTLRYFDRQELARRYAAYRPQVHDRVLQAVAEARSLARTHRALDVACGTGHSTSALAALADAACGCEIARTMLGCAAPGTPPLAQARAEALPFRSNTFDLLTVSMAFHWFDQRRFLSEAARVLAPGGEIWVYNLVFPGVLVDDAEFAEWHREAYLSRFPSPSRHGEKLEALVAGTEFEAAEDRWLSFEVGFSQDTLRNYFTTQSNVEAALRAGSSFAEVDGWLDAELAPFFEVHPERRFVYACHVEVAVAR